MQSRFCRLAAAASVSLATIVGCSAEPVDGEDEDVGAVSEGALSQGGGLTVLHYLGSSAFLRQCAGNTLGCGRAVASVSDSTPYFSAPRTWSRSTCDDWFTFEVNGRCVEAQRLEVSDRRNFIEGNPGLMRGLGLSHSDGRNCAGSGTHRNVRVTPGRHCDGSSRAPATTTDTSEAESDDAGGSCFSNTLGRTMPELTCVQSRSNSIWYQCKDGNWYRGVAVGGGEGPYGPCASSHALP